MSMCIGTPVVSFAYCIDVDMNIRTSTICRIVWVVGTNVCAGVDFSTDLEI